ncbi:MAG: hypothetical protein WD894_14045 [Pirellulales bacterium]
MTVSRDRGFVVAFNHVEDFEHDLGVHGFTDAKALIMAMPRRHLPDLAGRANQWFGGTVELM